jgi:rhamnosyl/mannosyltransferase
MDAIVATSPVYAESSPVLRKYLSSSKLKMIPLGIVEAPDDSNNSAPKDEYLKSLNIDQKPYLLFLGVLRYYKGLHTLVQAAKSIKSIIVIAGAGPEEALLRKQVSEKGIANIIFTGEVTESQKKILLKGCYALVLPSHLRSEAFGMVLIEAAMHSKPMISCEIKSGTSYANTDNETGYVVEPENPSQLAQAANALFSNAQQALTFGNNARKRYEELFSGPALGKAYSNLYQEILNKN